jgi:hypothetical protein
MNVPGLPSGFALKVPGLPFSFERKVPGLLFSFELEELNLPFIPGRQAREAIGPALLASPRSASSTMAPTITRSWKRGLRST